LSQIPVQPRPLQCEAGADTPHQLVELCSGHPLPEHLEKLGDEKDVRTGRQCRAWSKSRNRPRGVQYPLLSAFCIRTPWPWPLVRGFGVM
jgi:hypothetical protein